MQYRIAAAATATLPDAHASWLVRVGLPLLLALAVFLAGCSSFGSDEEPDHTVGWSAEQLYRDAKAQMAAGNWQEAIAQLERIQARYPFGVYAQQAMIDEAYAYWRDGSNEQALATIDRFQQQYPNNPATDYMLYLKGLINFTPPNAFLNRLVGQDPAERDPKALRASFDAFRELVERYPDSKYARDARERMNWLLNTIAMNEIYTARYYFDREAYVAAINRAETVVADFQTTPAVEQALYIMMVSYDKLGLTQLRDDMRRILTTNFPNTRLLEEGLPKREFKWWNPLTWSNG